MEGSSRQIEEPCCSPNNKKAHSTKEEKMLESPDSSENDSEEEIPLSKIRKVSYNYRTLHLKKAKYPWQIKSKNKYQHLLSKNEQFVSENQTADDSITENELDKQQSSADGTILVNLESISGIQNVEHSFIHHDQPITSSAPLNSNVCNDYNENVEMDIDVNLFSLGSAEFFNALAQIPVTIRPEIPADHVLHCMERFLSFFNRSNHNLLKWQTKQLAKGIIDNAINKVLEEMGLSPENDDDDNYTARNIEVEGVTEAIRQQGLFYQGLRDNWNLAGTVSRSTLNPGHVVSNKTSWSHSNENSNNQLLTCGRETNEFPSADQLLDTAVSCAITQKGLCIVSRND